MIIAIDGELVAPEAAHISVLDRGLLYGDGCFEVLRTWRGIARDLPAHLDRLAETAAFLRMRSVDRSGLTHVLDRALAAAGSGEHRIRIVLTRGPGALSVPLAEAGPGRTIVIVEPLPPLPREMSLALIDLPLPPQRARGHKTLAYLDHLVAKELARDAGADDALRTDATGAIAEGGTCNIFVVRSGWVLTPAIDAGILPGITRARILRLCERASLPVKVGPIERGEIFMADELFGSSALRGVVPITKVDAHALPHGPITRRIQSAFFAEMTNP